MFFLVGLFLVVVFWVMSMMCLLFFIVVLRVLIDFGWFMKSGMIMCGKMMMFCSGSSGSVMCFGGRSWVFDILFFYEWN